MASCNSQPSFTINGEVPGVAGKVVLSYENPVSKVKISDTAAIAEGKFVFKGSVEDVVPAMVKVLPEEGKPATARLYLENAPLTLKLNWESVREGGRRHGRVITKTEVAGGVNNAFKKAYAAIPDSILAQEKYKEYAAARAEFEKIDMSADWAGYMKASGEFMGTYKDVIDSVEVETQRAKVEFLKSNADVECAVEEYSKMVLGKASLEKLEEVFNIFTPRVQNSAMAQGLKKEIEILKAIQPGAVVPDFTLKNLADEEFTLSSLKGKYVILDFWASWCGPCRASIPGVKELYAKYKDKGLEIVGVSCDRKPEDWRKASEEEQLPWINLIDTQDANRAATKYAVHYIPSMFLLDQEGKMIGKMNHDELDAKLKELLGE